MKVKEYFHDPYSSVNPKVLKLEALYEEALLLNKDVGSNLDKYIQSSKIESLQDLEDFLRTWYNNYNSFKN
tara:strand:+ start:656 stop:868 length:213 start_codon:yes stop_codon:yes gene_type:complete